PNFVVIGANGRADRSQNISRIRLIGCLHGFNRFADNLLDRPLPTSMDDANHTLDWVMQQDRCAIGKTHKERNIGLVSEKGIAFKFRRARKHWGGSNHYVGAVYLPEVEHRMRVAPHSPKGPLTVCQHPFTLVADIAPKIERVPRRGA